MPNIIRIAKAIGYGVVIIGSDRDLEVFDVCDEEKNEGLNEEISETGR